MTRMYQDIAKWLVVRVSIEYLETATIKTKIFLGSMFPYSGCMAVREQSVRQREL
jgi:hypothetical protein